MALVSVPRRAARFAALAAILACGSPAVRAQEGPADPRDGPAPDPGAPPPAAPDAGGLDPDAPLAPLPDLGVDWPDLAAPVADGAVDGGAHAAAPTTSDAAAERRYRVVLEGVEGIADAKLRTRFNELSSLMQKDDDQANVAQIDRRAREDEKLLADLLRSLGYYDAQVAARVEAPPGNGGIVVTLTAEPGPLYRFADVALPGIEAAGEKASALRQAFELKADDPVDAEKVTAAETALRTALGREGFAFAKVGKADIVVDHETRTAQLTLPVEPDGEQRFGEIVVRGKQLFSRKHLGRIARFRRGDRYDTARIDDLRRALIQTGLVSSVEIKPEPGSEPGTVDLAVRLERAPPRTIAGEAGYGTGEGVRLEASWQHRNMIKPEGAVTFRGVAGTREQLLSAQLRRSNFKRRDQVLNAQIVASHSKRDAYDAKTFLVGGSLERQTNIIWQKKWTWSVGAELVASDERDVIAATGASRRRTFFIGAVPGTLAYDGSDDLLDPTRGYRLAGRFSPEASLQNGAFGYARAQIDASAYVPVAGRTTIAGRLRLASIFGASRDRIAPSRRYYAGGGGSVRGYGYQEIGPRDVDNDPIGGRSLAEFSIEARVRFGNFGVVPFLDAGNLYTTTLPKFTGLRYGAGLGVRYHTNFGPIRVDVGTPLNPQKGDPRVAVYVSLGQAF